VLKIILPLIAILSMPATLYSAQALIWEYDTLDIFFESTIGESIGCPHSIEKALRQNDHTYETYSYLPLDLSPYDVVFVTLGWYRC